MKIKRFEAPSMTDALRMIKKEFGEEAVILSAKNVKKPGRFLGGRSGQVIVTAAVDRDASGVTLCDDDGRAATVSEDRLASSFQRNERCSEGIGRILQQFKPITQTGRNKMQPKLVKLMNESTGRSENDSLGTMDASIVDTLVDQGIVRILSNEMAQQVKQLVNDDQTGFENVESALSQVIQARGWVASQRFQPRSKPAITVLVGPGGSGKTTNVVKMVAQEVLHGHQQVGIISLDNIRIAGLDMLQRYAGVMQVPFAAAANEKQLKECYEQMQDLDLILVDTPGLSPDELPQRGQLQRLLALFNTPVVHLVINAAHCEAAMDKAISFFKPLGVTHLLPTHLDWHEKWGGVINQLNHHQLCFGFFSNGSQIPENLGVVTSQELAALLLGDDMDDTDDLPLTVIKKTQLNTKDEQYVANCNSDIFHLNTCKSVSRINDDNILIFRDSDEAIEQGFKPCRMCCISLFVPKPIARPARRRVAGIRN